jgi:lysophospholipase L1-like esterase
MPHLAARPGRHTTIFVAAVVCAAILCGALAAAAHAAAAHAAAAHAAGTHRTTRTSRTVAGTTITPSTPVTPGSGYLALGDSVTFGYMEPTVVPAPDFADAASFHGYPEMLGSELGLKVANAACPGETSSSLINAGAQSNGCENSPGSSVSYRKAFPLHVKYSGSQLAYAVSYLKAHSDVRLVSLMIGANDGFICEETTTDGCASPSEIGPVLSHLSHNVHTILATLRNQAHYAGQIVIVDYYSLDYASPAVSALSAEINRAQDTAATPFHVRFANAYTTFAAASVHSGNDTCTAGLLTQLGTPGSCGVHPSFAGQALLASTVENAIRIR